MERHGLNPTASSVAALALLVLGCLATAVSAQGNSGTDKLVLPPVADVVVDMSEAPAKTPDASPAQIAPEPVSRTPAPVTPVQDPPAATQPAEFLPPPAEPVSAATIQAAAPAAPQPAVSTGATVAGETAELVPAIKAAVEAFASNTTSRTAEARRQRDAIAAYYKARDYEPIWRDHGAWTAAAKGALSRLGRAGEDALDLSGTPLPELRDATASENAAAELALSRATVSYGRQAGGSRVDPLTISKLITDRPDLSEPSAILNSVAGAADADDALHAFNPDHEGYRRLRAKLADLRQSKTADVPLHVAAGPVLKVGMKDPRVPALRDYFHVAADPTATDPTIYDARIAAAVAAYQRDNGILSNGQLTARTVAILSGAEPGRIEAEIIANMERWRWRAHSEAANRIEVNIPDYLVSVYQNDGVVHQARIIVGKPDTPTPVFSNRMQFIEVNPYWNVPESIIRKEMMPKLAADPTYLTRMGYEVTTSHGRMVVRQPPGERNALGRIKFMFPNQHAVYLHDTPTRGLFKNDRRAYSHGCVRVDDPFKLAEIVLGRDSGWTEDKVRKLIGGANRTIRLPKPLDIHIGYFTAFVDDSGKLQLRDDIYGYSHKLEVAMGLES